MNALKLLLSILGLLVMLAGCSSFRQVPRSELSADSSLEKVRVATFDGYEYRFDRVEIAADTLSGYFMVTVERTSGPEVWYEDEARMQRIPTAQVARVELVRRDPVKTAFYGASLAAAGYLLFTLVEEPSPEPRIKGGGGKGGVVIP